MGDGDFLKHFQDYYCNCYLLLLLLLQVLLLYTIITIITITGCEGSSPDENEMTISQRKGIPKSLPVDSLVPRELGRDPGGANS